MLDRLTRHAVALCFGAWVIGFVAYTATVGLPTKRSNVIAWLLLAIVALGVANPRRTARALVIDWSPLILFLAGYDLLRGASDSGRVGHTAPHLPFDEWIGFGTIPSVRLQEWLHVSGQVRWFDYVVWGTYISHFLVPLGLAAVLWALHSSRFRPYVYGIALLSFMSLATYWLYPAQPPWMTGQAGMHAPVDRIVHGMWQEVGVERAARVWEPSSATASNYSNPIAALPSMHAAFPMFILIMLSGIRRWLTALLCVYVVTMGISLVYAGEHFAFDVLLGLGVRGRRGVDRVDDLRDSRGARASLGCPSATSTSTRGRAAGHLPWCGTSGVAGLKVRGPVRTSLRSADHPGTPRPRTAKTPHPASSSLPRRRWCACFSAR